MEDIAFVGDGFGDGGGEGAAQELFGQAQGFGGQGEQFGDVLICFGQQIGRWVNGVDKAQFVGGGRVEPFAEHEQFGRFAVANQVGEEEAGGGFGDEGKVDEGQAETGGIG